jgi:ABC-type lipoprotein export system ATPase subunit
MLHIDSDVDRGDVVAVEMQSLHGGARQSRAHRGAEEAGDTEGELSPLASSVGDTVVMDHDEYFGGTGLDGHDGIGAGEELIVDVDNVHKTYLLGVEGVPALRGVSLGVRRGEFVCIFGTSGGGKSSLLNIIGTIDQPTKGSLYLCGRRVSHHTSDAQTAALRLRRIGFVFQTFNLVSSLTARENVELPMLLEGSRTRAQRRARSEELLALMGMSDRLGHLPSQLSGGEQQRVTIARSIANDPDILLLDEVGLCARVCVCVCVCVCVNACVCVRQGIPSPLFS